MYGIELTPEHPVAQLSDFAVQAEEAGFDAVFASHHYNNRDQFMALGGMASRTDEILLGPGIANPYETHPVTLASRTATLAEMSDGRALFGVGPGDKSTIRNLGFDHDDALRRVLETFKVAQRLWDGERVDHDGTFTADDAGLNYEVGEIPVYVGAQGPHMTRMAAKHADGALYNGAHPTDLAWAREQVEDMAEDRVADTEFDLAAYASVSVAEDAEQARAAARPPVAFVAAGSPPPVLDRHGIDHDVASDVGDAISAGEFEEAFGLVTEPMLEAFCIAGTPADVAERTEALREHADSVVFASPLGPDVERAISLLGAAVNGQYSPAE
ncbi:5,10-methylenetetrahydromethanopterin reductase [Haloarcula pellucida]|uniref:5,10-methylenetetrahydromethanopterin reductase n=1 Tax=Haloarcula pellucida TaxID=1427151 RepID=A0A830GPN7_9EURY|nr:5,10-methylenetetrahydromethanopterin reductase [Halomicroarcula pellucida]MBX0348957.1 5,10-methylenetetrahydromethanopterin reductase [Halomicroarcula pellucida]GGN98351.1 5,10-methylenetetrahydromethanopterin reductase [Halomicroarcula pellucida]